MKKLWNLQVGFKTLDIGHGFFIVKFEMMEDYSNVYMGGPWVMMDRYVTVRKWQPDFKSDEAEEDTTAIWVRFPNLPIEYYDEKVFYHISKALGKPLKIDIITAMAARGKYARVCIEMDLRKPFISHLTIGRYHYIVEYEHLHLLCFSCGHVGHRKEKCFEFSVMQPEKTIQNVTVSRSETDNGPGTSKPTRPKNKEIPTEAETYGYGSWTLATTRRKFQQGKPKQKAQSCNSNRFEGLQMDQDHGETSGDPKIKKAQKKYIDLDLDPQSTPTQPAQVMDMDLPKPMENGRLDLGMVLQSGPMDKREKPHATQHHNTHEGPNPSSGEQYNQENPNTLPTALLPNASNNTIAKTAVIAPDNSLKSRKGKPPDSSGRKEERNNGGNCRGHSDDRTSIYHRIRINWWLAEVKLLIQPWWEIDSHNVSHMVHVKPTKPLEDDQRSVRNILGLSETEDWPNLKVSAMDMIIWNCRGAGNVRFWRTLRELVSLHKPDMLILIETKVELNTMDMSFNNLEYTASTHVDSIGRSGSIWLLWNPSQANVRVHDATSQMITATISRQEYPDWVLSAVYASLNIIMRDELWNGLEAIAQNI
ncbi:hypothetical protein ACSBR2_024000 [Camellia fascicularis]